MENDDSQSPSRKKRPPVSARNKMMDFLARRDHSEKELRLKLAGRGHRKGKDLFTPEEIDQAITFAKECHWIPNSPDEQRALAEKMAASLRRKGKGIRFINQYLSGKGLPQADPNSVEELEKAISLVENKLSDLDSLDREEKAKKRAKIGRFLMSRGFDMEIVRKVIYGKV